jgi:PHD/YefM family antitoxin component YafN of YafNO toxin-antitoxin module
VCRCVAEYHETGRIRRYLLENEETVAITRHGDTVGYYIPARRKRAETERATLKEAASRLQQALAAEGISEKEILQGFERWRHSEHK